MIHILRGLEKESVFGEVCNNGAEREREIELAWRMFLGFDTRRFDFKRQPPPNNGCQYEFSLCLHSL